MFHTDITVYREIFATVLFLLLSLLLSSSEFKTDRIPMSQIITVETQLSLGEDRVNLFAIVEGQKLHNENNPVYSNASPIIRSLQYLNANTLLDLHHL